MFFGSCFGTVRNGFRSLERCYFTGEGAAWVKEVRFVKLNLFDPRFVEVKFVELRFTEWRFLI